MQLFDAPWISYEGGNIFSLDLHPNGTKLATAGQDGSGSGLLVIWDLGFSALNLTPDSGAPPKCNQNPLARIPHSSSVNCVRWSRLSEGKRLVCAGDDPVLCIYECTGVFSSLGSIDQQLSTSSKMINRNVESYRCTHKLFGHTLDVMHADFSPDGKYLASCSLDNTIIVWNALKFPEKITVLRESNGGHSRGVKGLSWDPVGRFLATQSEDNSLRIWQTDSWNCVQTFTQPFVDSAISTMFYRMDWSPNGCFLVAPCAMNNGGPTGKIFVRRDWSHSRDLVGFRKAVSCVRSNANCFQRTNSSGTHSTVSCFAVGSRDRSLSIWLIPNFGRPLLVIEKLFKDSVVDLSWSKLTLAVCSRDGVVKILKFTENEIGHMLSTNEMSQILERLYGIRPQFGSNLSVNKSHVEGQISSDFGFTSICEKIAKKAERSVISEPELFRIAFHQEGPKHRIPSKMFEQFVRRAKKQRFGDHRTSLDKQQQQQLSEKDALNEEDASKQHQQLVDEYGIRQRTEFRFYERNEEVEESEMNMEQIFELPEKKRLHTVLLEGEKINAVEIINNYPQKSNSEPTITRIVAYKKGEDHPIWSHFCRRLVSLLAANEIWTIAATFDAHLLAISTQTGRIIFDICQDEPLAVVQLQSDDPTLCLTINLRGALSVWDLPNRRRAMHSSIKQLITYRNQQLILATAIRLSPNLDEQATARIMFSDSSQFIYLHRLDGWFKCHSFLDLLNASNFPPNITSIIIPH